MFLDPENEEFPVCPALRVSNGRCGLDCRGLESAKARARQYKKDDIADKAQELQYKYGCEKQTASGRNKVLSPKRSLSPRTRIHLARGNLDRKDYESMTKKQLQVLLRKRGISGSKLLKADIIDRLLE